DGLRPDADSLYPDGPRHEARMRRSTGDQDRRRRRGREPELALRRTVPADDVRLADAAPDLLGAAPRADGVVAPDGAGALGVHRERALSRQLLVPVECRAHDAPG